MKKYLTVSNLLASLAIVTAVMLIAGVGVVKAGIDIGGTNGTTGPNSSNENEWNVENSMNIDISNHADANNDWDLDVATGMGDINHNTELGDISTGDIWGTIDVANNLNDGDIQLADTNIGDINVDFNNDTTGPNSENENEAKIEVKTDVDVSNHADIKNDTDLSANTGDNEIGHNTVVGDVSTGSVRFDVTQENNANANQGDIDLSGIGGTSVTGNFSNEITGPNSENSNELKVESKTDVDVHNSACINNDTEINANTGDNKVGNNTVVGDVSTGSIRIDINSTNNAN